MADKEGAQTDEGGEAPDDGVEAGAAPAADPLASDPSDALLSMFSHDGESLEDLSLLLELSPDVDFDDLLEELHTVAAALGISAGGGGELALAA